MSAFLRIMDKRIGLFVIPIQATSQNHEIDIPRASSYDPFRFELDSITGQSIMFLIIRMGQLHLV